jgi:hypothetical protein
MIAFTLPPDVADLRARVASFIKDVAIPAEARDIATRCTCWTSSPPRSSIEFETSRLLIRRCA